jgi:hypothetical protein
MNDVLKKLMTKYIRSVNAINIVAVYIVVSSILFLAFENYTLPLISETGRWINFLGLKINSNTEYLGTSVGILLSCILAIGFYLLAKKCKQGDLRFLIAVEIVYTIDSILSIFYFDWLSFLLHLAVLAYLLYGHYIYAKMVVEHEKYKNNRNKEE